MTFNEFLLLDDTEKEMTCWNRGVGIAERRDENYKYALYQVDGFYIEARYALPFFQLDHFSAFEDLALLDPYLQGVNIDSIYY